MKKQKPDFLRTNKEQETWYDLREDWALIESSLAKQYSIRIRQHTDMPWNEFCTLVSGLMPDTPLGSIVNIRSEKDTSAFNADQKKIHRDWLTRGAKEQLDDEEKLNADMLNLDKMLQNMFK